MTFLGAGLFFQDTPAVAVPNAAPSIPAVTLNFDFAPANVAPAGSNQALVFDVTPGGSQGTNAAPSGSNQGLVYEVTPS